MTALPAKEQVNFLFSIWSGSLIFDCSSFVNHEIFWCPRCHVSVLQWSSLSTCVYVSTLRLKSIHHVLTFKFTTCLCLFFLRFSIGLWHLFYKCNIIEIDERLSIQWPVRHLRIFTTKLTPHLPQYLQVNIFTSH